MSGQSDLISASVNTRSRDRRGLRAIPEQGLMVTTSIRTPNEKIALAAARAMSAAAGDAIRPRRARTSARVIAAP